MRKVYMKEVADIKRHKKSNPMAKLLKFFTPQVIKDKTKYNRKQDGRIWKRALWE